MSKITSTIFLRVLSLFTITHRRPLINTFFSRMNQLSTDWIKKKTSYQFFDHELILCEPCERYENLTFINFQINHIWLCACADDLHQFSRAPSVVFEIVSTGFFHPLFLCFLDVNSLSSEYQVQQKKWFDQKNLL